MAAYQARPKATPTGSTPEPQPRVRRDIIDSDGKLTLNRPGFSGGGFLPSEGFQTVLL